MEFQRAEWRKSSYSNGDGGVCVEVATLGNRQAVRDSKNVAGPVLTVRMDEWVAFIDATRRGEFV
jgi:hypothetical protein